MVLFVMLLIIYWHAICMPWLFAHCHFMVNIKTGVIIDWISMKVFLFFMCI